MIAAVDDYTHPVGAEPNFNESMYFQFYDPAARIGGFLRLANRPNERGGERTVCLYLPDGTVGFGFTRPRITANDTVNAAGLRVDIVKPMQELRVSFDGVVHLVADPRAMVDPKAALTSSPTVNCQVALRYLAAAPPYAETFDGDGESFAPHHYEQLAAVSGAVTVDAQTTTIAGHGLRDHSWGPRSWHAPWFYRWIHGCTNGFGFMVAYFGEPDGTSRRGGFVFDGGEVHVCDDVEVTTTRDGDGYQQSVTVAASASGRRWRLRGEALSSIPLRHRSADSEVSSRIVESAMHWQTDDGGSLYGMAEYLDQIRDGRAVGFQV